MGKRRIKVCNCLGTRYPGSPPSLPGCGRFRYLVAKIWEKQYHLLIRNLSPICFLRGHVSSIQHFSKTFYRTFGGWPYPPSIFSYCESSGGTPGNNLMWGFPVLGLSRLWGSAPRCPAGPGLAKILKKILLDTARYLLCHMYTLLSEGPINQISCCCIRFVYPCGFLWCWLPQ